VGTEVVDGIQVTFVGSSFITGQTGEMVSTSIGLYTKNIDSLLLKLI
jgi:hypothetical protein